MSFDVTNNTPEFRRRLRKAQAAGLLAGAQVLINGVKRGLAGGYTSGSFAQGNVLNSVTKSPVYAEPDGLGIDVGTNVPYALYWELGHHNIFTRRYERVPVWVPVAEHEGPATNEAFQRVFAREMEVAS